MAPPLTQSEKDLVQKPPLPYAKATTYSEPLEQLGAMLEAYGHPNEAYVIQGRHIINKTACKNLPLDITDMIKTAVNKVGGNVFYTKFDPDYLIGEVQTGNPNIQRRLPVVVLEGAITECDENLDTQGGGIDADAMIETGGTEIDIGAGGGKETDHSRIAIDLHLMDYSTQMLIPRKQTALAVDVWSLSKSYNFGFQVNGSGLGIDGSRKLTQGKHDAVRILVELSVIQLLGRLFEVPYWRCIPDADADPAVLKMIKSNFDQATDEVQVSTIQALLQRHGYSLEVSGKFDDATERAIREYALTADVFLAPTIDSALYSHLFVTMPLTLKAKQKTGTPVSSSKSQDDTDNIPQADSSPINLHTALVYTPRWSPLPMKLQYGDSLASGDRYKFIILPENDCYLYIFQLDTSGKASMLFPMKSFGEVRVNNQNPVKGKVTYTLPGPEMSFVLDQLTGSEKIYVLASNQPDPLLDELGLKLNQPDTLDDHYQLSRELTEYLSTKNLISDISPGKSVQLNAKGQKEINIDTDKMNISPDKVYLIEFDHR